jgi:hypothetical protein|tara:strand:- start:56 stop:478 length:423 start_codon:yes stop_codon:yes gene_type:complete
MKIKLIFWTIFIYILLTGCVDTVGECYSDYYLEIDAPNLEKSSDYYELEFLPEYIQTFTTIRARTGSEYQKISWISDKGIELASVWTNLVNSTSYTDGGGYAYTVLGVWEEFIGDTIIVYCGYEDMCSLRYIDSLKVIIE